MAPSTTSARTISTASLLTVLGLLASLGSLATDMYLPAFSQMQDHFKVAEGGVETTLSVFFLGLALGQAIYGPIIDRYGRKVPLICGLALYVLTTVFCLFTTDIVWFVALRFLQAVGGCSGMIVGRAIVNDLFDERESASGLSLLMAVTMLAPIVAPILGGFLIAYSGWQAIFLFMLVFGLLCLVLVYRLVPETLKVRERPSVSTTLLVWKSLIKDRLFLLPALVGGLAQASMFAFITGSPSVLMEVNGVSAQTYSWLFALVGLALVVFSQINRVALRGGTPKLLLTLGLILHLVGGLGTLVAAFVGSLPLLMITLWFSIGALGLIGANATALAMSASGEHSGSGSSIVGVLQFGCAFLASTIVAITQNGSAYPMPVTIACCGGAAAGLWFISRSQQNTEH